MNESVSPLVSRIRGGLPNWQQKKLRNTSMSILPGHLTLLAPEGRLNLLKLPTSDRDRPMSYRQSRSRWSDQPIGPWPSQ